MRHRCKLGKKQNYQLWTNSFIITIVITNHSLLKGIIQAIIQHFPIYIYSKVTWKYCTQGDRVLSWVFSKCEITILLFPADHSADWKGVTKHAVPDHPSTVSGGQRSSSNIYVLKYVRNDQGQGQGQYKEQKSKNTNSSFSKSSWGWSLARGGVRAPGGKYWKWTNSLDAQSCKCLFVQKEYKCTM